MKEKVSVKVLLFFLLPLFLIAVVYCMTSGIFVKAPQKNTNAGFAQTDLTGTWHVYSLYAGSRPGWIRSIITVGSDGKVTYDSYQDSSDVRPATAVLVIDKTTGIVTDSGHPGNHLTMAANKKIIAGTLNASGTTRPGIIIFQKEVPGTVYDESDLQKKDFVYHELKLCGIHKDKNEWEYGAGGTDSDSKVTRSSKIKPGGIYVSLEELGPMSVDRKGIVRMSDDKIFEGFLSPDKKTIIGTTTKKDIATYIMLIIQMTDNQSASTANMAGTWYNHTLTAGSVFLWSHETVNITDNGQAAFSHLTTSDSAIINPTGAKTFSVSSSGAVTLSGSNVPAAAFHGQISYDSTFIVATQTPNSGEYSLMIFTRKP